MKYRINDNTFLNETTDTVYITFKSLENLDGIYHGLSTRLGGVSTAFAVYDDNTGLRDKLNIKYKDSMNLGFSHEPERSTVLKNYEIISSAIGFDYKKTVLPNQQHTCVVREVTREHAGQGIITDKCDEPIDAQITNSPGITLTAFGADCPPVFLADPVAKCVGIAHSGRKGTYLSIAAATVSAMTEKYGSKPSDIIAVIGPHICQNCYEIGDDVASEFAIRVKEENIDRDALRATSVPGKYLLNMSSFIIHDLVNAGVRKENISDSDFCTKCHPGILYSYRIEGNKRGGLAGFIGIKE